MKTTKIVKPVSRTVAAATPAKPQKPAGKPVATVQATGFPIARPAMGKPAGKPVAPPHAAPAKPAAPPVDTGALLATIEALKGEISKLSAKAQKASRGNVRSSAEILENGTNGIADTDWRLPYQGGEINSRQFSLKAGELSLIDGPSVPTMLAIPRSTDPGGNGTAMRLTGHIALHWALNESGEYEGAPEYLTTDQLATVWAD